MAVDVALILGYDALGDVVPAIQAVKAASLIPIVVLNPTGADYSAWLPQELILRSANVNRNHRALIQEIRNTEAFFDGSRIHVRAILNGQDRMWLCYLDLKRSFPNAAGIPPEYIVRTSIKPNLRFLLRPTSYHVPHVLVPSRFLKHGELLHYRPLRDLVKKSKRLIVKPVIGAGGLGVEHIEKGGTFEDALHRAVQHALDAQKSMYGDKVMAPFLELGPACRRPINDFILIEEYIDGPEYSMEGLATPDGEISCFVEQKKTRRVKEPVFRDLEYLVCSIHPAKRALESVSALLKAADFKAFPFHIELKGTAKRGLKPVEFNPRAGGGSIVDLVSTIHAVDLRAIGIKATLDQIRTRRCYVTVVVQPEKTGTIRRYFGLDQIQQQPDCVFVKKLVGEGSRIDRMDREAYLVEFCVSGKTANDSRKRANEFLTWISVEID